jgi:hypothetical protein
MAAVNLRPIHKVRLKNLNAVIAARFKGNASEAARAIERSHTFIWQLLNGYRSIGEETARNIEARLKLGELALDQDGRRTQRLVAHLGAGREPAEYRVVPVHSLDSLDAKARDFVACPYTGASERTFAAMITSDDMVELREGDQVFIDRANVELVHRKLFCVRVAKRAACVMQAQKVAGRWVFALTDDDAAEKQRPIDAGALTVIGRVMLVVRNL